MFFSKNMCRKQFKQLKESLYDVDNVEIASIIRRTHHTNATRTNFVCDSQTRQPGIERTKIRLYLELANQVVKELNLTRILNWMAIPINLATMRKLG